MSMWFSLRPLLAASLAISVLAGAGSAVAGAQTGDQAAAPATQPVKQLDFSSASALAASGSKSDALFSSSNAESYDPGQTAQTQLASIEKVVLLPDANAMQYGQRRRYGAPRYRGGNTNADGSEKYDFYAGAGITDPITANSNYLSTSYGVQVGGGRNFNKHVGLNLEFDYDHFGMTGQTITNQSILYFNDPTNGNGLDANSHILSLSLQPTYQIYSGQGLGAYLTGGVGFYHKVANFTLPQQQQYCDYIYGCYGVYVNANVDHYTSNAPGFDGGIGLTYKFSRFANEKFYGEVRYVYIDNSSKPGVTSATDPTTLANYTGYNFFPQNSQKTSYIPIKFGLRF